MRACRRIRPWIARSVDAELAPAEALRLARHIERCTSCRIVLAREARLAAMLDGLDDPVIVDESFFGAVMAALPELPVRSAVEVSRRARWRRGLKLATLASIAVLGCGLASRALLSLRFDVATAAMPRFTPDDANGWISFLGSAAQWIRMTAQSMAWAGSSGELGPRTIGVLSLEAAVVCAAALLAVSGALALATRAGSRAS